MLVTAVPHPRGIAREPLGPRHADSSRPGAGTRRPSATRSASWSAGLGRRDRVHSLGNPARTAPRGPRPDRRGRPRPRPPARQGGSGQHVPAAGQWRALLLTLWVTGARMESVLRLRWHDVDWPAGRVLSRAPDLKQRKDTRPDIRRALLCPARIRGGDPGLLPWNDNRRTLSPPLVPRDSAGGQHRGALPEARRTRARLHGELPAVRLPCVSVRPCPAQPGEPQLAEPDGPHLRGDDGALPAVGRAPNDRLPRLPCADVGRRRPEGKQPRNAGEDSEDDGVPGGESVT